MKPIDEKTALATLNFSNAGIVPGAGMVKVPPTSSILYHAIVNKKWKKESVQQVLVSGGSR